MTMPNERFNAIIQARDFLRDLLDPKKTPRVPKKIREQSYWCLRHFISEYELEQLANKCPNVLKGKR
jgi:hypothetical protein